MAIKDKTTLKTYFETGAIPTQNQYTDLIDSLKQRGGASDSLSKQELILMANKLATINKVYIDYYVENIGNAKILLDATPQNGQNQIIELRDTLENQLRQYFIGDAPYTVRLKEFQSEKLNQLEYYYFHWQISKEYHLQRLSGNNLPDMPKGFDFGVVDGRNFYIEISRIGIGKKINVVHTNIKVVNTTDVAIAYRAESGSWGDNYKTGDTATDHYDAWDYLSFYLNADMSSQTQDLVWTIYNNDNNQLIQTIRLSPGQNYENTWGGNIYGLRNVRIECTNNNA